MDLPATTPVNANSSSSARSALRRRRIGSLTLALAGVLGLATTTALILAAGPGNVARDVLSLRAGLLLVLAYHLVEIACAALAWRMLLAGHRRAAPAMFMRARWIREAINALLPIPHIGDAVIGARILTQHDFALRFAAASVILDKLLEGFSMLAFILAGLGLFIVLRGETQFLLWFEIGLVVAGLALPAALLAQRAGLFRLVERLLLALARRLNSATLETVAGLDDALCTLSGAGIMASAGMVHLAAWVAGAGEVWLALRFMNYPIGAAEALVLESLAVAIRTAGFAVPAALGVQEGGYLVIGALLGLPPEVALALSLVRRIGQIALGIPALIVWQMAEARHLLAPIRNLEAAAPPPSTALNA
jgi:putative membrane protein